MTQILENSNKDQFALPTSLVHLGSSESSYLQIFNKRKRTRWDDNPKPSKNFTINIHYLDIKTVSSRKSRWGSSLEKSFTPLPFTQIPEGTDVDSFEILIRKYRLDDVNRRIQANDWENADPDIRSPSPEPIYDSKGHRLNIREVRTKEKYIKEKNSLIEQLILLDDTYKPPSDYRPPKKIKKIFINEIDNEKHKLVGLILGVGGATQRELEKKSGCKISVRGKGSNWKGNLNSDFSVYDENEPLHVYVVAENDEQIMKACSVIEPILDPYSQEHMYYKQMQKQAIAVMYGYQTDTACENCGEKHRTWACPLNFSDFEKVDVRCAICHDKSHPTIDCPERKKVDETEVESELVKFLKEVDEFKKSADIPVLEMEIKPDDIRNSILYTGKIPEMETNKDYEIFDLKPNYSQTITNVNQEIIDKSVNNDNQLEDIIINDKFKSQGYEVSNSNTNNLSQNMNISTNPQTNNNNNINNLPNIPQVSNSLPNSGQPEYRVPLIPIVNNPNVIRSLPVTYMQNNPFFVNQTFNAAGNNSYYNYLSPINGVNYFPMNPHLQNAYTKNFNLISSNFQGKIPTSYSGMNLSPLLNFPSRNRIYDYSNVSNMMYVNGTQNYMRPQFPTQMNSNMNSYPNQMNLIQNNVGYAKRPTVPNAPSADGEIPLPPEPEEENNFRGIPEENQNEEEKNIYVSNNSKEDEDIQIEKLD